MIINILVEEKSNLMKKIIAVSLIILMIILFFVFKDNPIKNTKIIDPHIIEAHFHKLPHIKAPQIGHLGAMNITFDYVPLNIKKDVSGIKGKIKIYDGYNDLVATIKVKRDIDLKKHMPIWSHCNYAYLRDYPLKERLAVRKIKPGYKSIFHVESLIYADGEVEKFDDK